MKRLLKRVHKIFAGNKGLSLVEVIAALTILGIVTVPIAATFINSMHTSKLGDEQIEISAITRIVKENVADAVKQDTDVFGITSGGAIDTSTADITESDLAVLDRENNSYPFYRFDVTYLRENYGCKELRIVLKKDRGTGSFEKIREFYIEVNPLTKGTGLDP